MIKVGIAGAETRPAGELIRLLLGHPDIVLSVIEAPTHSGLSVSALHHGLLGEIPLLFSGTFDPAALDVVFICNSESALTFQQLYNHFKKLRIIDLTDSLGIDPESSEAVLGLSELYRKPLVRGARAASIPAPIPAVALIALYPLASHMLLNDSIHLKVEAPDDVCTPLALHKAVSVITYRLEMLQPSFRHSVEVIASPWSHPRAIRVSFTLKCSLALEEVIRIYENIYDDHNFTFIVGQPARACDVAGTQKCLIALHKSGSHILDVDIVADCRMRGGAGDAVHVMNLLFGLHEKVGLSLKVADY
ncbi:MAG: hypothetical protein K2H47_07690 [Muribaculaceae bacterium]|nr:hypothetical protein [Muribaculaceae bacterium]